MVWEVPSEKKRSRFWTMIAASILVHLFLTPIPALLGIVAMLPALQLTEDEDLVEVELTELPMAPAAPVPDRTAPAAEEAKPAPAPEESLKSEEGEKARPEAEEPEEPEVPTPPVEAPPGPTAEFGDPVALSGKAGKITDSEANVRLMIFNQTVRNHPLGDRVGKLLRRTPQWSDFFGPSDIDPVRDIDQVLIAGPQLRNSSQVIAVVQHKLGNERIEKAFESLVARKGEWIDRGKLLARARADRAERIFAAPNDHIVVVAPPNLEKRLQELDPAVGFDPVAPDVAMTAYVVTPGNVARKMGVSLLDGLKWVRVDVRPLPDGGAIVRSLAEDTDEQSAKNHALLFETLIREATTRSFMGFTKTFIKSVQFKTDGKKILGELVLTHNQLQVVADILDGYLPPAKGESQAGAGSYGTLRLPGTLPLPSDPSAAEDSGSPGRSPSAPSRAPAPSPDPSPAPESPAPESPAPESPAPESPAPESPAPESPAPFPAPTAPAPQDGAP